MKEALSPAVPTYDLYGENRRDRSQFWMHAETIAARSRLYHWEIKPHQHDAFFQILYIRGGTGEALFDGRIHALGAGSIVTIPPRHPHGFRFSRDMDGLVITVAVARIASLVGPLADGGPLAQPRILQIDQAGPDGAYLAATLERLGAALSNASTAPRQIAEPCLGVALCLLGQMHTGDRPAPPAGLDDRIARLLALIATHAREHQPIGFYAAKLGISTTHLNRLVAAAGRGSVGALLAQTLIDEACRLLVFTGLGIADVGGNLGFSDAAYFSRFFSQRMGVTPRSYRLAERRKLAA